MSTPACDQLEALQRKLTALGGAAAQLHWDQAAMMPAGGAEARADQLATLSVLMHEMVATTQVGDLIDEALTEEGLEDWRKTNLDLFIRDYKRATLLPSDFVEAMSRAESKTERIWRAARPDNDFKSLAAPLDGIITLVREQAEIFAKAFGLEPYDALLDMYDPGRRCAQIDEVFDDLAEFLPPFLETVLHAQSKNPPLRIEGSFPVAAQKALGEQIMAVLGFRFDNGRLDTSAHPFTGGTPDDVRLTTRYAEDDFTQGLMGVIHETGHALYEQGLPKDWRGFGIGDSQGMTIHESQSLLFEMQAGRSPAFVRYLAPRARAAFNGTGPAWQTDNLIRLYKHVKPGLIRVDADEVTYPLHIILRYRIEKALLSGDLAVTDLPQAWNAGMKDLLGVDVPDDTDGCLQDIHWPSGAIGYFPTYTLGALTAAQLFATAREQIDGLDTQIELGNFKALLDWLRQKIHQKGSSLSPDELIREATGAPLSTAAFKQHLEMRYG